MSKTDTKTTTQTQQREQPPHPPQGEGNKDETGYIYCLSNPLFDGVLKIATTDLPPDDKARELTGHDAIPLSFNIFKAHQCHKSK